MQTEKGIGKMYNVILNMYNDVKSCINYNNCKSDYFSCDMGVRQGENLCPFLFALFLNDLQNVYPLEKMKILVFSTFTFSFHFWQYSPKMFNRACRSSRDSAIITVSSKASWERKTYQVLKQFQKKMRKI
jgi:hypothetical protein